MSQFFNRYIPTSETSSTTRSIPEPSTEKRKRNKGLEDSTSAENKKKKQRRTVDSKIPDNNFGGAHNGDQATESANDVLDGRSILNKYSVSRTAKSLDENVAITHKKKRKKSSSEKTEVTNKDEDEVEDSKSHDRVLSDDEEDHNNKKHSGVLRKYDKSRKRSNENDSQQDVDVDALDTQSGLQSQTLHDLVPIPQPANIEVESKAPTYSILPAWQADATNIKPLQAVDFEKLGLSDKMLSNLRGHDLHTAFPVQSAVIPLLMHGNESYQGDLCISAATGSGKTLAYVIPIVENLRRDNRSGLRAVIVVPTRELVKQVREICQICASGSNLNIVTALGSKSLRDEQKTLIDEEDVYDPEAYQVELHTPIDWTTFSLERALKRGSRKDPTKLKDHVTRTRVKADILITTPGRLVDHLQETDGFHLDNVEWLVVDEADRLLNESYQDWVDIVVPALQSRKVTQERDKILNYMRMKPPPRIVRKILLSATMTKDISKLNHIGLTNPRMIKFNSSSDEPSPDNTADTTAEGDQLVIDDSGKHALPEFLREVAIGLKDGTDKPLVLLQLLEKHVSTANQNNSTAPEATESSSDDSASDSSSSPGSSTESDSEDSSSDASSSTFSNKSSPRQKQSHFIKSRRQPPNLNKSSRAGSLVFTRSTAAALRLSRLLSIISPKLETRVATLTRSAASSSTSRKALSSFRSGKTSILIATDRASRGIDIPGLENVISYDIPGSALTYIHRVGRTARAGKEGHAWTLVEHREGKWFWNEIGGKSSTCMIRRSTKIKKMTVAADEDDSELRKRYEDALAILGSEVRGE